jgi:hypothetical protein
MNLKSAIEPALESAIESAEPALESVELALEPVLESAGSALESALESAEPLLFLPSVQYLLRLVQKVQRG